MTDVYPKSSFLDETGVKRVPIENVEAIAKLKPDLIIAYSQNDQVEKYKKIAKTITFTTSEHSFKEMHIEIGKILGKESLAKKQIQEMDEQLKKTAKRSKQKLVKTRRSPLWMCSLSRCTYLVQTLVVEERLSIKGMDSVCLKSRESSTKRRVSRYFIRRDE